METIHVPSILYKYTTSATAKIILQNGKLRWSSPSLFNDLAEFQRMPRFEPTLAKSLELLPQIITDAALGLTLIDESRLSPITKTLLNIVKRLTEIGVNREQLQDVLQHEQSTIADEKLNQTLRDFFVTMDIEQARVLCLTANYVNEVMWGTYAENHYGCVLGFTHLPELSTPFLLAQPVSYSDLSPVIGSGIDFLLYGDSPELRRKTMAAVCYNKKLSWSYEEEWRTMTWSWEEKDQSFGDYKFYPGELESITFGARTTEETKQVICKLISERYPQVVIHQMVAERECLIRKLVER